MPNNTPDWNQLERDVIHKLMLLRAAWEHTARSLPELHQEMARDLYIPNLKLLAKFCAAIKEDELFDADQA